MQPDDRPTIDESYISANHTSNLRVVADKRCSADILIAAGWSDTRIGSALLRLASEWDGAAKKPGMSDTDMQLLKIQLKSLKSVLEQVVHVMANKMRIDNAEAKAGPIVGYWLNQCCPACHGLKFQQIRDTPVLGALRCRTCMGTGIGWAPGEFEGKRVLAWMDDSVARSRQSIRVRLRSY